MYGTLEVKEGKPFDADFLRINNAGIHAKLNFFKFQDADTEQFICYLPAVDISGYGESEEKALEMIKFSISEYFNYLGSLTPKKKEQELRQLGWKPDKMRNKEFSKVLADEEKYLQSFNAANGKVERLTLEAA